MVRGHWQTTQKQGVAINTTLYTVVYCFFGKSAMAQTPLALDVQLVPHFISVGVLPLPHDCNTPQELWHRAKQQTHPHLDMLARGDSKKNAFER